MNKIIVILTLFTGSLNLGAQDSKTLENINYFIEQKAQEWQLSEGDLNDKIISDYYSSGKVIHCYFQQQYNGYKIENAIIGIHLKQDGTPFYGTSKFISDVGSKINTFNPTISAKTAVQKAFETLNIDASNISKRNFYY